MRIKTLDVPHGQLRLPLFVPDATFGVVRSLDTNDLLKCGIQAVVMNVFHLMQRPGSSTIKALGGLHSYSNWHHPIITDSGGFQTYSLFRQNAKLGAYTTKGITFRGANRKFHLTPEKSIRLQLDYGSDIVICLDDCTHPDEPYERQLESVTRTVNWARRCKLEFQQAIGRQKTFEGVRPLLFAVVQGGASSELRKKCANSLLQMGFDGFAYGGYPISSDGRLLSDVLNLTRNLIPSEFPMLALGIGQPQNIMECLRMGYELFDSSMPTRDARQGRLYLLRELHHPKVRAGNWLSCIYIQDVKYAKTKEPISSKCNCLTCREYSLAYLHHLFKLNDSLYQRLATIHNLTFITSQIKSVM
jgi:queuine tRNA-ribosyltransferase